MSETTAIGFPEAAHRLGVPLRQLRQAIRSGRIPAPPQAAATARLPAEWLASAQAAVATSPKALSWATRQRVPAFARFEGTSAWQEYPRRARAYARFRATP